MYSISRFQFIQNTWGIHVHNFIDLLNSKLAIYNGVTLPLVFILLFNDNDCALMSKPLMYSVYKNPFSYCNKIIIKIPKEYFNDKFLSSVILSMT